MKVKGLRYTLTMFALVAGLMVAACQETTTIVFGQLVVLVRDQTGAPVFGALVDATYENGSRALSGSTGADGRYAQRVLYNEPLTVTVTPPAGYTVPATQQNPIPFTAMEGNARLEFTLNRTEE